MATHSSILAQRMPQTEERGRLQSVCLESWTKLKRLNTCISVQLYSAHNRWRVHVKLLQSCLTLCDPTDCSLPHSSVHRILQARILEWVAMLSSGASSQPRDRTRVSCVSCIGGFFTTRATWEAWHACMLGINSVFFCLEQGRLWMPHPFPFI